MIRSSQNHRASKIGQNCQSPFLLFALAQSKQGRKDDHEKCARSFPGYRANGHDPCHDRKPVNIMQVLRGMLFSKCYADAQDLPSYLSEKINGSSKHLFDRRIARRKCLAYLPFLHASFSRKPWLDSARIIADEHDHAEHKQEHG